MKILAVDIGTGTQDVFLFDTELDVENGFKLIVPSPTMIIHKRVKDATKRGVPILLTGLTMGGGPSHWAVEDHVRSGLPVYATAAAARSFNDDLDEIGEMGIQIVSEDEASRLGKNVERFDLKDFDFGALVSAFSSFGVSLKDLDALAVAVFDHGAAPPKYSDRRFRFEYIHRQIAVQNRLSAFAFPSGEIPEIMTRLQAVARSAENVDAPLIVMDTAPAAVLGATLDPQVRNRERVMIANIGNFHTLAFRLGPTGIEGVFEHHTGLLDKTKMEDNLVNFAAGTLTNEFIFADKGHGAITLLEEPLAIPPGKTRETNSDFGVVITGPRRKMLAGSFLRPYFAAPFGDVMLLGCFGMLDAVADLLPNFADPIRSTLQGLGGSGTPPWEVIR